MPKPYVKQDTFWGDVVNSLFLRPPYREPVSVVHPMGGAEQVVKDVPAEQSVKDSTAERPADQSVKDSPVEQPAQDTSAEQIPKDTPSEQSTEQHLTDLVNRILIQRELTQTADSRSLIHQLLPKIPTGRQFKLVEPRAGGKGYRVIGPRGFASAHKVTRSKGESLLGTGIIGLDGHSVPANIRVLTSAEIMKLSTDKKEDDTTQRFPKILGLFDRFTGHSYFNIQRHQLIFPMLKDDTYAVIPIEHLPKGIKELEGIEEVLIFDNHPSWDALSKERAGETHVPSISPTSGNTGSEKVSPKDGSSRSERPIYWEGNNPPTEKK